ncbi:MAG: hypothetical protein A2Z20_04135 [Bdellovibrionales bacterium RBG_16_40_8]|nr:MAG: hypothetical protein A2Z20_04135 [Bdellovibrionales bacterium RBG_16_40_8]
MQVTDETRRILSGRPNKKGYRELKSNYLEISKSDIQDPIVAIAAGTRWLAHKYSIIPGTVRGRPMPNTWKNFIKSLRNAAKALIIFTIGNVSDPLEEGVA